MGCSGVYYGRPVLGVLHLDVGGDYWQVIFSATFLLVWSGKLDGALALMLMACFLHCCMSLYRSGHFLFMRLGGLSSAWRWSRINEILSCMAIKRFSCSLNLLPIILSMFWLLGIWSLPWWGSWLLLMGLLLMHFSDSLWLRIGVAWQMENILSPGRVPYIWLLVPSWLWFLLCCHTWVLTHRCTLLACLGWSAVQSELTLLAESASLLFCQGVKFIKCDIPIQGICLQGCLCPVQGCLLASPVLSSSSQSGRDKSLLVHR